MVRRLASRPRTIAIALLFVSALTVALVFAARLAAVGVAYKAKMVCSGVFVAGLSVRQVLADLERDDLAVLRYVHADVRDQPPSVVASALGVLERRASYHPATGCALTYGAATGGTGVSSTVAEVGAQPAPARASRDESYEGHGASGALRQVFDDAFAEPDPERPRRTLAVVVMRRGEIVAERYAPGIEPSTPLIGWSMTKSVMNAMVGVLVRQGRLSLSMRAPLREWQDNTDPRRDITIDQLLHMSSGLHFAEETINPLNDTIRMLLQEPDAGAYAAAQRLERRAGSTWQYSSGTTNILSRIVRSVIGNDAEYHAFPRRALFDPLGMTSAVVEADDSGTFVASSLMYASARDWARFGTLYLQDGMWDGQQILPEGWVAYTRTPAPADPQHHYGAHFWLDVPEGYRRDTDDLPEDLFHAAGHEGQFVTIVPSRGLVIVRLGRTRHHGAWDQVRFVREVMRALTED